MRAIEAITNHVQDGKIPASFQIIKGELIPILPLSVHTTKQLCKWEANYTENGQKYRVVATIEHDDQCGNGHNTFSITGDIYLCDVSHKPVRNIGGGCIHEVITKHIPELAPFIKWHLCSTDGPMHYVADTTFHAGNKDCHGYEAGQPNAFDYGVRFEGSPITTRIKSKRFWNYLRANYGGRFEPVAIAHTKTAGESYQFGPKYSVKGYVIDNRTPEDQNPAFVRAPQWHECPFDDLTQAQEMCEALNTCVASFVEVPTDYSTGKVRDLDVARNAAVWADATDEELTAPDLKERLLARLPALLVEFKRDVESLGFVY